jgi:hypothetical protein
MIGAVIIFILFTCFCFAILWGFEWKLRCELDRREREEFAKENLELEKYSESFRKMHLRWQDWGSELLESRGLQLPHGLWGDYEMRKIIGNVIEVRDPFDGFEDPKFHEMLLERDK